MINDVFCNAHLKILDIFLRLNNQAFENLSESRRRVIIHDQTRPVSIQLDRASERSTRHQRKMSALGFELRQL